MEQRKHSPNRNLQKTRCELSSNTCRTLAIRRNSHRQYEVSHYDKLSEMIQDLQAEHQRLRNDLKEAEARCDEFQQLFVKADKEVAQLKDVIIKNRREFEDEKTKVEKIVREKNKKLSQAKEEKNREKLEKQAVRFRLDIEAIREELQSEKELHKKTEEKFQELCKIIEEQENRIYHFQNNMRQEFQQNLNLLSDMLQPLKKRKLADNDN